MKRFLYKLSCLLLFTACTTKVADTADPQVIIDTDHAFSDMSIAEGVTKAFLHYADSSAVIFRNGTSPLQGYAAIVESYSNANQEASLNWRAEHGDIAASGELGYTWGQYFLTLPDSLGNSIPQTGYYMTVWKKQPDGYWKFVFDGGTVPMQQESP